MKTNKFCFLFFLFLFFTAFAATIRAQNYNVLPAVEEVEKKSYQAEFWPTASAEYWFSPYTFLSAGYLPLSYSRERKAVILMGSNQNGYFQSDYCGDCYEVVDQSGYPIREAYDWYLPEPRDIEFKVLDKHTGETIGFGTYRHEKSDKWQAYEFPAEKERIDGVIPLDFSAVIPIRQSPFLLLMGVGGNLEVGNETVNHVRFHTALGFSLLTRRFSLFPNSIVLRGKTSFPFGNNEFFMSGADLDIYLTDWLGFKIGYNYFHLKVLSLDTPWPPPANYWREVVFEEEILNKSIFSAGLSLRYYKKQE